ncbi:5-(carboxyamino)imidazole ribonucleotide mutase [Coxiella endosymbiont of Amblyomma americanum]|uniref:5-(carboxyamino)imidazole ribonucleotide mutase n=1 Tax=Coxiella endosymbiont of Amblyomma americanum TaxID=325775 RepID=UPI00057F18EA|nr:5-(carboxyamino)imidazole ribonucleotide mutase [Coxiella endosymbiont of Amblyomma americanum]AJC50359.1 phosphoribosylaminoimidazole carboxylase [Coxiella endosymbiont of Amblyomma americanum]AUJ59032.1 5-(carboxyamino)imidazole ribonucleotide mutase [Coxiella-like endosymbiont of Amblyomma americanum]
MNKYFVAILIGSTSNIPIIETAFIELKSLNIPFEAHILSAHRSPEATRDFVEKAEKRGCAVFIAVAGLSAHLAGTVASYTIKPVIGIPIDTNSLGGLDALLSTVQMPGDIPVACTTIGRPGAKNAALLAAQIIAIGDSVIAEKLRKKRTATQTLLRREDEKLQIAIHRYK